MDGSALPLPDSGTKNKNNTWQTFWTMIIGAAIGGGGVFMGRWIYVVLKARVK